MLFAPAPTELGNDDLWWASPRVFVPSAEVVTRPLHPWSHFLLLAVGNIHGLCSQRRSQELFSRVQDVVTCSFG